MPSHRPRKRHRALKACTSCRRLKKKCDGEQPCSYCNRFQHECRYEQQTSRDASSRSPSPEFGQSSANKRRSSQTHERDEAFVEQSIIDPEKGRYFDSSSAIAFPRLLGMQYGASKAPRLHSFGWNLGIRPEPSLKGLNITQFISLDDVQTYSEMYFRSVHPTFDFLDEQEFNRYVSLKWNSTANGEVEDFDAVVCGVVALGCFFSPESDHDVEAALVAVAKDQLDGRGLATLPTVDLIAGWLLRAIYLRATTRPHASWMATNILMHLIEASGIHRKLSTVAIIYPSTPSTVNEEGQDLYRRKIFWVGRALHTILAYEFSRPRIDIVNITCERVESKVNAGTCKLLHLAEDIPQNSQTCRDDSDVQDTLLLIKTIATANIFGIPLSLFAADVAFAAYRHVRSHITSILSKSDPMSTHLLAIGNVALRELNRHLFSAGSSSQSPSTQSIMPWWSLVFTPFHFILVLLSLDSPDSLASIPLALQTLQAVAQTFDTHLTREAMQNATMLIRLCHNRKEGDAHFLRQALLQSTTQPNLATSSSAYISSSHNLTAAPISTPAAEKRNSTFKKIDKHHDGQHPNTTDNIDGIGDKSFLGDIVDGNVQGSENFTFNTNWDELFQNLDWM